MSATHINRWLHVAKDPAPSARDFGVSAIATVALFAAAFAAMTSLRTVGVFQRVAPDERVTWVPVPAPVAPRPLPPAVRTPQVAPREVPTPVDRAPVAPTVTPTTIPPRATPADTSAMPTAAATQSPAIPLSMVPAKTRPYVPREAAGGAPISTAAVTARHGTMTTRIRDSIMATSMGEVPDLAGPISSGRGISGKVPGRSTGEAVAGVGVTLPFPIFEPGPSAAQRKRDAVIAADNSARLFRLEARMYQQRDSIRLDSLRRDSLKTRTPPPS